MKTTVVTHKDRVEQAEKAASEAEKAKNKIKKQLEKEYKKVRKSSEDIRQAYAYYEGAQEFDDIYYRLLSLEKQVKRIRRGRFFSSGARKHHRLLKKLQKISVE